MADAIEKSEIIRCGSFCCRFNIFASVKQIALCGLNASSAHFLNSSWHMLDYVQVLLVSTCIMHKKQKYGDRMKRDAQMRQMVPSELGIN